MITIRGAVPETFALDACVDGNGVWLENSLDIPVGVNWQGGFGALQVIASDETLGAQVSQTLANKDESQLLPPGDKVFRPLDASPATVTVAAEPAAAMNYVLANRITDVIGDLLDDLDNAVPLVAEQITVYTRFHSCVVKAKKSKAKLARCASKLKTEVAVAAKRGGVRLNKRTVNRLVVAYKDWRGDKLVKDQLKLLSPAEKVLRLGKATNTAPVITSIAAPPKPAGAGVTVVVSYDDPECDVAEYQNYPQGQLVQNFLPIDSRNGSSGSCAEGRGTLNWGPYTCFRGMPPWYMRLRDSKGNLSQLVPYQFVCT